MSDYLIPLTAPGRATFRYVDSTGVSTGAYTGLKRTATMGGDRMGATLEFSNLQGAGSAAVIAWLMRLRGKQNRAILSDVASRPRGVFPTGELLGNYRFASGSTGWTCHANYTLTVVDGIARALLGTGGSSVPAIEMSATAAVTAGAAYVARYMVHAGRGTFPNGFMLAVGTTVGGYDVLNPAADLGFGLKTVSFIAPGGVIATRLSPHATGANVGDYIDVPYGSLARCILVTGAGQTGSGLTVDALPTSTAGLLLPGDQAEVITSKGSELKYTTSPLNSDGSGAGYWQFEPPLRGAPADNAPVIVHRPMGRFLFTGNVPEWVNEPGILMSASFDFEETAG